MLAPLVGERAGGDFRVERGHDGIGLRRDDGDVRDWGLEALAQPFRAQQHRAGDDQVADEIKSAENESDRAQPPRPAARTEAERLKHRIDAVQ